MLGELVHFESNKILDQFEVVSSFQNQHLIKLVRRNGGKSELEVPFKRSGPLSLISRLAFNAILAPVAILSPCNCQR